MKLRDILLNDAAYDAQAGAAEVRGVCADSRKVQPGDIFFALAGAKADGAAFVMQATKAGAAAIVADHALDAGQVPFAHAANARLTLARAAARLYPRQPDTIAAVTGTSGKTSVAAFTRQIWQALGHRAASIGTVGIVSPKGEIYGSLTTPDPVDLHRSIDELARDHVTHLVLEASSHGLDQYRLDGVRVQAGAFTNLSRDHMDYHPSVEAYLNAKLRLFTDLVALGGAAVIAADHAESARVIDAAKARGLKIFTVGRAGDAIRLVEAKADGFAQRLTLEYAGRNCHVALPLLGAFQIENALVAAGLAIATGSDAMRVLTALENLKGAKGRLELVGTHRGAPIFIDYAHKPDALAKALEALRPYTNGRLVVVFGAGGDRDAGKRPLMGEIAAQLADHVIITDDNPRSEDPAAIRAAIRASVPDAQEIGDRATAIRDGIAMLGAGDVLLIAGKGHETGQIVGNVTHPFSDHDVVARVLAEVAA